ncbi:MAG: hypothetical protein WB297_09160 [Actinomycetota bacterium]
MGSARRLIAPIALLVPLPLLPACSEDEPGPVVEPSSAFQPTGNTAATGSSGATGQTGGLPTGSLPTTAGGTDPSTVGIGGLSLTGTQPTSPTLSLTITVQDENAFTTFISSAGECRITIGQASADRVSGAFTCTDLSGGSDVVVDVAGSFDAQG